MHPSLALRGDKELPGPGPETRTKVSSTCPRHVDSLDWPLVCLKLLDRCPETEGRQETTEVAAREIPEGVARLSAPLRLRAERTERSTCGRPLHPGTLAGLAERSPEGAEERRTPCNAVHPALPKQGLPSTVLSCKCQDRFIEDSLD